LEEKEMKTIYLVNKQEDDGSIHLVSVPYKEWRAVVDINPNLPIDQRRYFISDYNFDGDTPDCIIIESDRDTYFKWLKEHIASQRNRKAGKAFQILSLDACTTIGDEQVNFADVIPSAQKVEDDVCFKIALKSLCDELAAWKPWATDLLAFYLKGKKKSCTDMMAKKYGVSPQMIRRYKKDFENFVKNFFR